MLKYPKISNTIAKTCCLFSEEYGNNNRTGSWRPYQRESNYFEKDIRYYAHDVDDRNVEPVVYRVDMDQRGLAVQTTIRVKGHPVKAIIDIRASVSIIILLIVKQL